ncbi:MAG: magnesium/cobalt transporter CorA [Acidobacteriota bacterium]
MSRKFLRKKKVRRRAQPGSPPGTLVYVGEERPIRTRVTVIDYGPDHLTEEVTKQTESLAGLADGDSVTWINVEGLQETRLIAELGERFGLHPLMLEDILNTDQRPKVEFYIDHVFFVLRMLWFEGEDLHELHSEQVSLVLGQGYVLSFQETLGDVFEPVRARLRTSSQRIRTMGPDYLMYALIDAVVDHYFLVLERMDDRSEMLEAMVFGNFRPETLQEVQRLKRDLVPLRRAVWPIREALGTLVRDENPLIHPEVRVFLRDVYDHSVRVLETVEVLRDTSSSLLDIYLSALSNRMNEVMKVLTVIATIFIPLTFIAGVYGMNFRYMPELQMRWAYPALWGVFIVITVLMIFYFRRRNWL